MGFQALAAMMGVPLGRFDALMTHQFLHCIEIHAASDQPGGESVPQIMEMQILNAGLFYSSHKSIF